MATLVDIIQVLTDRTRQGKVNWRSAGHGRILRSNFGDFRVNVEYHDWDNREYYTLEVQNSDERTMDSSRSYETEGALAQLFMAANESAFGLTDRRQELLDLITVL